MSRIIAIYNPKEAVGKTTTALNLAQAFALGGQGALLVDFDYQDGVSSHLGVARPRSGLFGRILDGQEDPSSIGLLVRSVVAGLDVVPCDVQAEGQALSDAAAEHLGEALHVLRFQYPWCVIDCPSVDDDPWSRAALRVSDTVVIPVEAELFGRESTAGMLDAVRSAWPADEGGRQRVALLMTRFRDGNSLSSDLRRDLAFEYPDILSPTVIPHDPRVPISQEENKSLLQLDLESRASRAYVQFAKEVMSYDRTQAR